MTKHLYFFVNVKDALRLSQELTLLGYTNYYLQPHDDQVAFVFERVTDMSRIVLRHVFGADGSSQLDH
ncbi:MAG TPA: hypothetical protein VEZ13_02200 [Brevibacillus sp.]|nr:hypothetical protein [Brevibacillus sp.]